MIRAKYSPESYFTTVLSHRAPPLSADERLQAFGAVISRLTCSDNRANAVLGVSVLPRTTLFVLSSFGLSPKNFRARSVLRIPPTGDA